MKSKNNPFHSTAVSGAASVVACFSMLNPSAQAADQLWIGSVGNQNVTTPGNWGSWVSEGDTCASWSPFVFGSNVQNGSVNLNRWVAISSITLTPDLTHDITIDNGPIIMGGSLVDMSTATHDLTLNAQVQQGWGDMTFNVGAGRTLTANGGVAESGWFGLHTGLTKNGAGTVVLGGASTYTLDTFINAGTLELGGTGTLGGGSYAGAIINYGAFVHRGSANQTLAAISGNGSITQSGTGTLTISGWGVGNGGDITVNSGTLAMPDGPWNLESHHIVVNGGTLSTSDGNSQALSWTLNGGTVSSRGDVSPTFWGNMMLKDGQAVTAGGAAVSTISSHVMLGAGSEFAVSAGSTLNVTGAVSNSVWAGGPGSFIKTGNGTLALSGANNYTGTTTVNGGTIQYSSVAAANSTSKITVNSGGGIYFDPGTTNGPVSAPIELNGVGNGDGALRTYAEGGQLTFSGLVTLLGNSMIQGFAAGSTLNFTNTIGGTGNLTFLGNGGGLGHKDFMVLSGASNFTGDLYIENYAALAQITLSGGDNRLPTTAVVHIGAGSWNAAHASALDLNGNNQMIAGLSDSGVSSLAGARSVVNTNGTLVTLTLNTTADQSSGATIGGTNINGTAGNNLALVKSGANTQTLTGINTYSGDTTVNGGTLKLDQINSNNESSTVSIAATAGAKLDLAFAGTDTVDTLYINGVQQPAGDYTSANTPSAFTGGGTLHVASGPAAGYDLWKAVNAPTGTPGNDYDGDGVTNGVEFVLGGTKDTNEVSQLPAISTSGTDMVFSFLRAQASIDGTTTVAIQVGTNLSAWPDSYNVPGTAQANNPGVTVVKDTSAGFDTVTLTVPRGSDAVKFARLVVTPAP